MTNSTNKPAGRGAVPFRPAAALCLLLLFGAAAGHWSPVRAADPKIGFINIKKAVAQTNEFKRTKAQFDKDFEKEQKIIAAREAKVKQMFEELNKQGFVLSPELKKQKEEQFFREKKSLERYVQDKNEEFGRREKEITQRITRRLLDVLKTIGKERKFTLIAEVGSTFFYDDARDITDLAVETYNKIHK